MLEEVFEGFKDAFTNEYYVEQCIKDLERDLEIAVFNEDYERAANIRNKLYDLQGII